MRLKILVSAHFWNVKLGITFAGNAFLIKMATKNTVRRWISCFCLLRRFFQTAFIEDFIFSGTPVGAYFLPADASFSAQFSHYRYRTNQADLPNRFAARDTCL